MAVMDVQEFAERYFSEHNGKSVPLDLLLAWLSMEHEHDEDGVPKVPSMDLHRWAQSNAIRRVVDVDENPSDGAVTHIFEHGWHKDGCEWRLAQAKARIVRTSGEGVGIPVSATLAPTGRGGYIVKGTLPVEVANQLKKIDDFSIRED